MNIQVDDELKNYKHEIKVRISYEEMLGMMLKSSNFNKDVHFKYAYSDSYENIEKLLSKFGETLKISKSDNQNILNEINFKGKKIKKQGKKDIKITKGLGYKRNKNHKFI